MLEWAELQDLSVRLFTDLLTRELSDPQRVQPFSWFEPADAVAAALTAFRLSAAAVTQSDTADGLRRALAIITDEAAQHDPELTRQALALFVTHNEAGRQLTKPRTVRAAPGLFTAPEVGGIGPALSIGGASPQLDYWREDVLANEHHQHWHEVYPYVGRPPTSFAEWVGEVSTDDMATLLEAIAPRGDWAATVATAAPQELAEIFAAALDDAGRRRLSDAFFAQTVPRRVLRRLLRLNDRHGELFGYMHRQMLARYDAELHSGGMDRVSPFGPDDWSREISEGYDPEGLTAGRLPFTIRQAGRRISDERPKPDEPSHLELLQALQRQVDDVLRSGVVPSADGSEPERAVDAQSLGEFVEEHLHNTGHGILAFLSDPDPQTPRGSQRRRGVMGSTLAAIRDQIFWRWHKHIDNLIAQWEDTRDPETFSDGPPVTMRDAIDGAPSQWTSPDIILVRTSDLPDRSPDELAELGEQLFGGEHWDTDYTAAGAEADGVALTTLAELVTFFDDAAVVPGGPRIRFLTHAPFTYFLRVHNRSDQPVEVTARIFLAPAAPKWADDRRAWIEMDKFTVALQAGQKAVLHRPDTQSAVIKRPAETSPARISRGEPDEQNSSYCDCGWPYTLLLPRGSADGMACRLLVMFTDARLDNVEQPGHCGSMSFCGARDRYPDRREMGYPFARPFGSDAPNAIGDTLLALPHCAARSVLIRHV